MSEQLSIFGTGIICWHCNNDPGVKVSNAAHWNGFFDADTQQFVCYGCRVHHYGLKGKTEHAGMMSEVPVVVETELLKRSIRNKKTK